MTWRRISVVLTSACNLRCRYCCLERGSARVLDWDALRGSLEVLLPLCQERIDVTFTGGEPLLAAPTLRRAVSYIEQRIDCSRIQWRVLTNGLLLDRDTLSFLDAHGFIVNLSFDGVPAAHAQRDPATHARLDSLLDELRHQYTGLFRDRLKVCLTLTPETIACLSDSVAYFLTKSLNAFLISPVTGAVAWEPRRIVELQSAFESVRAALLRHYDDTGRVPLLLFRKSASDEHGHLPLWACRVADGETAVIDVDGETYACLPPTETYRRRPAPALRAAVEALRLGSAQAPNFSERRAAMAAAAQAAGVFDHPERRYSSYRKCADCEFLGRCRICPLASVSIPGWDDMYRVSDFLCAFNQVAVAARDRFPAQPTAEDFFAGRVPLSALRFGGSAAHDEAPEA